MSQPVAPKVKAATAGAYLGFSALIYVLELVAAQPVLVTSLPDPIEPLVLAVIPALVTLVGGWLAPHQPRAGG